MRFEYWVLIYSGPEDVEKRIQAADIVEADGIVRAEISAHPRWRAVIYPKHVREDKPTSPL